jgi:Family of unknown function (DUF6375)
MKIWSGFGSEHSMNLVMIGRFEDARDAEAAKLLIDRLTALVDEEQAAGQLVVGEPQGRFSDKVLDFLSTNNFVILGPDELEQFAYDVRVKHSGKTIELTTDESDVSAFLKVLIDHRARVEVFSAHFHETDKSAGG